LPPSAKAIAVVQAAEVFPTPPFPVKKRMRVGFWISADIAFFQRCECSKAQSSWPLRSSEDAIALRMQTAELGHRALN
jgi:hypothetical protein